MRLWAVWFVWALWVQAAVCAAQTTGAGPSALEGVGVDQRLGERVPMDVALTDSSGRIVTLRDCFRGKPVVVTPVYFECPSLCTVTLNQLSRSLSALKESVGTDFDVVTFSINPNETSDLAAQKKAGYLKGYRRAGAEEGWHFLTGSEVEVKRLAEAIGFRYRWDEASQQFIHAGAVVVISPEGKISRYFLGVDYPPTELRAALQAAGRSEVARPAEQVFLYCFRFDPTTGKYGLIISRALKVMGAGLILGLGGLVVALNRIHAGRSKGGAHAAG